METMRRSFAKALSWRAVAWSITAGIVYLFTGKVAFALSIGFADSILKIFMYFLHERAWMSVEYGREPVAAYPRPQPDEVRAELAS